MGQILLNYLALVILPFCIGLSLRFFCRRWNKVHFLTIGLILLAVAVCIAAYVIPSRGSELYGLRALQASCLAAGSQLMDIIFRIRRKK